MQLRAKSFSTPFDAHLFPIKFHSMACPWHFHGMFVDFAMLFKAFFSTGGGAGPKEKQRAQTASKKSGHRRRDIENKAVYVPRTTLRPLL